MQWYTYKHTSLIQKSIDLYIRASQRYREVMSMPRGRPPSCPYCGSHNSQRKGFRKTKTMGARQIRLCKGCKRKFTPKHQTPIQPNAV
jgi:transposase-like protein